MTVPRLATSAAFASALLFFAPAAHAQALFCARSGRAIRHPGLGKCPVWPRLPRHHVTVLDSTAAKTTPRL